MRPTREQPPTLVAAVDAFLAQPDLADSSRRSYSQTLGRLRRELGPERPLQWVSGRELERAVVEAWGACAPATWNRHLATLRSFSAFCARQGWVSEPLADVLARRREPADRTRAIPFAQLERLWRRDDVAVREKALWRLLYETAVRGGEGRHGLARDVCHGRRGELRQPYRQGQEEQLNALGLIVNSIVLYNTIFTQRALDHVAVSTGNEPRDEDIERLSPLGSDHITLTGRYRILLPAPLHDRSAYRALNTTDEAAAA